MDTTLGNELQRGYILQTLPEVYPEYQWYSWPFQPAIPGLWTELEMHLKYFEWLKEELDVREDSDWYDVSLDDIRRRGGNLLLQTYGNSIYNALCAIYPQDEKEEKKERRWNVWCFSNSVPNGFWDNLNNQRAYFEWLADNFAIEKVEDWYQLTVADVYAMYGGGLITMFYNASFMEAVSYLFPELTFQMWKFGRVPDGFWNNINNQREYFQWIQKEFGIKKPEQWYSLRCSDLRKLKGGGLMLHYFNNDITAAVKTIFPEYDWKDWLFQTCSPEYWNDRKHHRTFLEWLADEQGIDRLEQWYDLQSSTVVARGGLSLLRLYDDSLPKLLQTVLPELNWNEMLLERVSTINIREHRQYFDRVADQLGLECLEQWYSVPHDEVNKGVGRLFLQQYKGSLITALEMLFPEIHWYPWMFQKVPAGFWHDKQNVTAYLQWLSDQLQIRDLDDWSRATRRQVRQLGGSSLFQYGSLADWLSKLHPSHSFDATAFDASYKVQLHLLQILRDVEFCVPRAPAAAVGSVA